MSLADDLTRTIVAMANGWRLDQIARARRAQEQNEMMTATNTDATPDRDHEAAVHLARAIVRDAERLARTVAESGDDGGLSINVHHDGLARAALSLPESWRNDFLSRDGNGEMTPHTSVTVGPVKFFAAVQL